MSNSSEGCLEWLELSNDPEKLYSYLNKHVRVQWRSGTRFSSGWVYTIDPVSMSMVLVSMNNGVAKQVEVVTGEEIQSVQVDVCDELNAQIVETEMSKLFYESEKDTDTSNIELETKRDRLVDWIKKNHLPVRLENFQGDLVRINILDTVFIKPPYTLNTCESTNEIILDRVRLLIKNFENKD